MKRLLPIRNVRRGKVLLLAGLLVLGTSVGAAALFANSAPSFNRARNYPTGHDPTSVAIGDLNGDGKPDLATANSEASSVSVLLNRGGGSFQAKLDYRTGTWPTGVAMGDLNDDGKEDLTTANFIADTVSVLINRGDGSFQPSLDYRSSQDTASPHSVAIGDLNGDGKPDLATANSQVGGGSASVFANRGDGSFGLGLDYPTACCPHSIAISDLNGDSKPELAIANPNANSVFVLVNRGDGSFRAKRSYRTGHEPSSVAIGDLNGDRKPDLATANFDANTVSLLVNRGDGGFQWKLDYRTKRGPASAAIGDLNGDGKLDLATANYDAGSVSVLLNTPGRCTVQDVERQTLPAAKRTIARANCRVGRVRRAFSKTIKKGRVISQKPKPGAVLRGGGKVNLVVSRGRRAS